MKTVKLGGVRLNDYFAIANISRPLPEVKRQTIEVDGVDGEELVGVTLAPRTVSFDMMAKCISETKLQDMARKLMELAFSRKAVAMTISDEKDPSGSQLVRYVVPDGSFDVEEVRKAGRWRASFFQPDPFLYGKKRTAVIPGVYQNIIVDAGGNQPTPFTAVAYPTGSIYVVRARPAADTDNSRAEEVCYEADFNGRDKLTVNTKTLKVSKQNSKSTDSGLRVESRFFMLDGKMNVTASCKTTLSWTERWL
jgi:predicted phage tail component-like protein